MTARLWQRLGMFGVVFFCCLCSVPARQAAAAAPGYTPVRLIEEYDANDAKFIQLFPNGASFKTSIPHGQTTPGMVNVEFPRGLSWSLERNGEEMSYLSGDFLYEPGDYRFIVMSGEYYGEYSFHIAEVSVASAENGAITVYPPYSYADGMFYYTFENNRTFSANVPNGAITAYGVRLDLPKDLICLLTRDGETFLYQSGDILTEQGRYFLRVVSPMDVPLPDISLFTDEPLADVGSTADLERAFNEMLESGEYDFNDSTTPDSLLPGESYQTFFSFQIITQPTRTAALFNLPPGFAFSGVYRNGKPITTTGASFHRFTQDGEYAFVLRDKTGAAPNQAVSLTVDTTPPRVALDGVAKWGTAKGAVGVSVSEPGAALSVFRNGVETIPSDEYREAGDYRVIATDAAGNRTVFGFEIVFTPPRTLVLLAILAAAAAGAGYVVYSRSRMTVE